MDARQRRSQLEVKARRRVFGVTSRTCTDSGLPFQVPVLVIVSGVLGGSSEGSAALALWGGMPPRQAKEQARALAEQRTEGALGRTPDEQLKV